MKKLMIKTVAALSMTLSLTACGDSWLETDFYDGLEQESALNTPSHVEFALNGAYRQLMYYCFAGNYSTMIGDIASDLTYQLSSASYSHFRTLNRFTYTANDTYLLYIWQYGYEVIDDAARVIEACELLYPTAEQEELPLLKRYEAEARCLRAYSSLVLANVFCHQVKVAGQDYSSMPGIVLVDKPIKPFETVSRSTIGETYRQITSDLLTAIGLFENYDYDYYMLDGSHFNVYYFNEESAYGLLARAYTYLEQWDEAAEAAENAISISGIYQLAYDDLDYEDLYSGDTTNWESMLALAINDQDNWSANSCGTLFTTYRWMCSPYLYNLYGSEDCRLSIMTWYSPWNYFWGGKFNFGYGNSAYATNYLINAPEMYLIQAEAYANMNQIEDAQSSLFVVAHRNAAIETPEDLPSTQSGILSFLKEERARELFQEGHRLWDLRRWGEPANLYATSAPQVGYRYTNVNVSDIVFPIPADEINAGYGVTQNENWASTRPQ